jgi:2-oxoglutarate dehydrogenase E2 component (dihydrolipoamide succinyltransferase)
MSDIKVPEMGESITEGTISRWLVAVGDTVGSGDVLAELETDKVNLEISAEHSGVLQDILKQEGETVRIGEVIGRLSTEAKPAQNPSAENAAGQEETSERISGEKPNNVTGFTATAPADGGEKGQQESGDARVDTGRQAPSQTAMFVAPPSIRRQAREQGVDLQQVAAKGGLNRIQPDSVNAYAEKPAVKKSPAPASMGQQADDDSRIERQKMSRRRVTIARRLVEAQRTAAMLTTFNEVDMTKILDIRKRRKQGFQDKHDVGLGFMSFFTKAVVGALKAFPRLNAEIQGEDILLKKFYDIGIAVSAPEGLVVPVVRDADRLGFAEIEKRIGELAAKARSNTLALSDLQGGSFTITNGGVFGSLLSTPILNAPQVGILGMHTIQLRPVAIDAERMENRPMMYIALSYDHRIVDGSEAVRFLVTVKEMLEDPETLLLES